MVRHISIFYFKENVTTDQMNYVLSLLNQLQFNLDLVNDYRVGQNCMTLPQTSAKNAPLFGNIAQVIDFITMEAAKDYPSHPAHLQLMADISSYIEKVAVIDYIIESGKEYNHEPQE